MYVAVSIIWKWVKSENLTTLVLSFLIENQTPPFNSEVILLYLEG